MGMMSFSTIALSRMGQNPRTPGEDDKEMHVVVLTHPHPPRLKTEASNGQPDKTHEFPTRCERKQIGKDNGLLRHMKEWGKRTTLG